MKRILPFSLVIITALILAACGGASAESPEQFIDNYSVSGGAPMPAQDAVMPA